MSAIELAVGRWWGRLACGVMVCAAMGCAAGAVMGQDALMCQTEGEGPAIIFLHDLGSSAEHWDYPRFVLRHDHRVILIDFPGHGSTPPVTGELTFDDLVKAVEATVAGHVSDKFTLVGHGLGGMVAIKYAVLHPNQLRALVLVDTMPKAELPKEQAADLLEDLETDFINHIPSWYMRAWVSRREGFQTRVLDTVLKTDRRSYIQLFKEYQGVDLTGSLRDIQAPTLVVYQPGWMPSRSHDEYVAFTEYDKIPNVTFKRIENAGHFLMYDAYNDFNSGLSDFLWRVEQRKDDDPRTITTPSGLKYIDVRVGEGRRAEANTVVTAHSVGRLSDGTVIQRSDSRSAGRPWRRRLGDAGWIPGVAEGIADMREGGQRKLILPPHLGYGLVKYLNVPRGSTVDYEVELIRVETSPPIPAVNGSVVTSASGLEYIELVEGEGPQPSIDSVIEFDCDGWHADGNYAMGSFESGEPYHVPVGAVPIAAWKEALQSMRPGGSRLLLPRGRSVLGQSAEAVPSDAGAPEAAIYRMTLRRILSPETLVPADTSTLEKKTTPSGVTYADVRVGEWSPVDGELQGYSMDYTCWLSDGTFVESTLLRGPTSSLRVEELPRGLVEGLSTMRVGGERQITVPPELAYGEEGLPPTIPTNATLTYEVRLRYLVR